ncbi:Placental protein 11 [Harpegnathos saltator]|uniref:Placental protein 11 n=1 Tax=Harpegnathos saltator TaxID=610380 RepID=E2BWB9_HARSA|nr:Placental protein 11 [Harpegnathos saltator]
MLRNPSHLEIVNPVSMGKTRAIMQTIEEGAYGQDDNTQWSDKVINIQVVSLGLLLPMIGADRVHLHLLILENRLLTLLMVAADSLRWGRRDNPSILDNRVRVYRHSNQLNLFNDEEESTILLLIKNLELGENKHKTTTKRPAEGPPEVPGPISLPNLVTGPSIMDLIPDKKKDNTDDDTDDDTKPKEKKVYSSNPIYSSNPTYSKENTVTDEDLEKLTETLYIKEMNNANQYITLNLQQKTTSGSPTDQAPQPLLTVSAEAFQIPTIQRVLSIFDNYQLDTHMDEYISPVQRQEEKLLIDTFLSTSVMSAAMRFLADKGFVQQDYYKYRDTLRGIWFNLFSRGQGKIGSAGFEQAFMAETRQADSGTEIYGLHNWIYFNAEETKRHIDYLGYMNKVDLGNKGSIVKVYVKFNGHDKPVTTMFVGTSPELEMALYTVCFYARPNGKCPVSLGGTKFNIVTYKFKYRGQDLIGTAYPEI